MFEEALKYTTRETTSAGAWTGISESLQHLRFANPGAFAPRFFNHGTHLHVHSFYYSIL